MPLGARSQRSGMPARSAQVSGRQARQARAHLADRGLPHREQRRLQAVIRSHEDAARQRRGRLKRLGIADPYEVR